MIKIETGVEDLVNSQAKTEGIKEPVVIITDCGCMLNQETIEIDIVEEKKAKKMEFFTEVSDIKFFIDPKLKIRALNGRIVVTTYGDGKFKRLDFLQP